MPAQDEGETAPRLPEWMRAVLRPPYLLARRGLRAITKGTPALASFARSALRDPAQAVSAWEAPDFAPGPDVALYVHFDAQGNVAPYVLHALAELRRGGLCVLFVTNSGRLRPEAEAALREVAAGILVRRNIGYDFGAMREGLAHWRLPRPETRMVLLTNDSVLGPFASLAPMLARLDFAQADLWAAVDSRQRRYHLQSWWIAAGRRALHSDAWRRFWAGVRPVRNKEWVIARYELGLSRSLLRAGLRARALWPCAMLEQAALHAAPSGSLLQQRQAARIRRLRRRGMTLNPTADLWRQLLDAGCPYVKRELVTRNPAGVVDAAEWRGAVPAAALRQLRL